MTERDLNEVNNNETKVPAYELIFRSVLLSNSKFQLHQNRCICKLITKRTAAYMCANEQLGLWFLGLSVNFQLWIFTSENYAKR